MPVAELIGGQPLQLGFIRLQQRLPQRLDILLDGSFVAGFGKRRRAEQKTRHAERERPRDGQVTTGYLHRFLPSLYVVRSTLGFACSVTMPDRLVERKSPSPLSRKLPQSHDIHFRREDRSGLRGEECRQTRNSELQSESWLFLDVISLASLSSN